MNVRPHLTTLSFVLLLAAVSVFPLAALWRTFGPDAHRAPDFTLTDQDGHPFTLSTLRGHQVVLFFGYTHCPDSCPTALAHLAQAVHSPDAPRDVRVVFITVDPERDSPAVLARYVRLFDPHFIGLTGSASSLEPVYSAYHAWRQAVPVKHGPDDYLMAHSAATYYIGRNGSLRGYGAWDETTPAIVDDLKKFQ